jgi:ABC-2 type transport system permease protein
MLFPPAIMQLALNDIARTDLDSYLGYLASVSAYHEALKHTFFPVIFNRLTVGEVDWAAAPQHTYRHQIASTAVALRGIVALTITAIALATIAALRNSTTPRKKRVVGAPDRRGETGRKT